MLLSVDWLTEFTPYDGTIEDLAHLLTMLGLEVEEIQYPFAHLDSYVVGRVEDCTAHPNADKLCLCTVDIGSGHTESIVCGAPNIASGQNVVVAPVGAVLPNGQVIKRVRIRGQESAGMILSEQEMELSDDHSGIKVLPEQSTPGSPVSQTLGLDRAFFDLGITPNRSDCLSVLGVAREVAAACNLPLHPPQFQLLESDLETNSVFQVRIDAPDLCPVYQARIIEAFTLGKSPDWMRFRLLGMGIRPINNIVDVTNYVMLELGQPLHAFDRHNISGDMIQVGRAQPKQSFTTLDDQERILGKDDLLIWDREKPIALAGVMGGANSEITAASQDLVLESAVFDPPTVRKTGRRLGLSSESAYRFERGVDQPGSAFALDRATYLINTLAGGHVLRGQVWSEPRPWKAPTIPFRLQRSQDLLALNVDTAFCRRTLANLGCQIQEQNGHWEIIPPSYRLDLEREIDLIEEIGRVYGLEAIPTTLPRINKPLHEVTEPEQDTAGYGFMHRIKNWAQGLGLLEVINYSFVGGWELDQLGLSAANRVQVYNPLSSDQDTMRTSLTPGLMRNVRLNADQGNTTCRFFELARIFESDIQSETSVREHTRLGLLLTGARHPQTWPFEQIESDYLDLKGIVESLFGYLGLTNCRFLYAYDHPFLDPGVRMEHEENQLGFLGRLKPEVARKSHARFPVWIAELDLDVLNRYFRAQKILYRPWAKYPPVHRDMTVIAGAQVTFGQIEELIANQDVQGLLEDIRLVDVYQPEARDERHLTMRMRYRHAHKTLTDKEVDAAHSALGQTLTSLLPVRFPST
ncbi:MAG: phenylalanine--tRNA ligase subunit beta [Desulfovermiculus sp.]